MRKIIFVLVAVLCASAAMRMPANAQYIPAGSYQDSCDTIQINGPILYARCQDRGGAWHQTSTNMEQCPSRSFANNDGALVCGRGGWGIAMSLPPGSWRSTCINASENGGMLNAQCDTPSGQWNSTSLAMYDCPSGIVDNSYGNLICRGGSVASLPGGSWAKSCRNASIQGTMMYAQCSTGYGGWNQTSFDIARFPNAQLANDHGTLIFERGQFFRQLE
jgi:hypothetical protein